MPLTSYVFLVLNVCILIGPSLTESHFDEIANSLGTIPFTAVGPKADKLLVICLSKLFLNFPQTFPVRSPPATADPWSVPHTPHVVIRLAVDWLANWRTDGDGVGRLPAPVDVVRLITDFWEFQNATDFMKDMKVLETLNCVFEQLVDPSHDAPSSALVLLLAKIPSHVIAQTTVYTTSAPEVTESQLILLLERLAHWPFGGNIGQWVNGLVGGLAQARKYSVLIRTSPALARSACQQTGDPGLRQLAFPVLEKLLLGYQHSADVFHNLIPDLTKLLDLRPVETQATNESSSTVADNNSTQPAISTTGGSSDDVPPKPMTPRDRTESLATSAWRPVQVPTGQDRIKLAEVVYTLIYHFSGYPEKYTALLELLSDIPAPTEPHMASRLFEHAWAAVGEAVVEEMPDHKTTLGLTGLSNLGNTCFMNSILQSMYMTDAFTHQLFSLERVTEAASESKTWPLLQLLFAHLAASVRPSVPPSAFLSSLPHEWRRGSQQDAMEFSKFLSDRIECELEGTVGKANDPFTRCFGGLQESTVICDTCRTSSTLEEPFTDISLPMECLIGERADSISGGLRTSSEPEQHAPASTSATPSLARTTPSSGFLISVDSSAVDPELSSHMLAADTHPPPPPSVRRQQASTTISGDLTDLLAHYFLPESMSGENKYRCENCQSLQNATKTTVVVSPPQHLVVSLKRFSFDWGSQTRSKLLHSVPIPLTLDLPTKHGPFPYALYAVVVHAGSTTQSGHYYTYARHSERLFELYQQPETSGSRHLSEEDDWWLFNDSTVSRSSAGAWNLAGRTFVTDLPYVAFYRRLRDPAPPASCIDNTAARTTPLCSGKVALPPALADVVSKDNANYQEELARSARKPVFRASALASQSCAAWRPPDDDEDNANFRSGGFSAGPGWIFLRS
eukprot:gnl/Spiro4/24099_TR11946_c0_g1_i1.p1 gnl/Spiro4/24099_TR11946_c0_g1~~gnl/Spiro4/24099_TR11946_c0_g1_i1.p1  ORF type:complete len:907 (+),score=129.00 gnl/Spiro4/24099_TR11946_c0_g1_i1:398-3118(+)